MKRAICIFFLACVSVFAVQITKPEVPKNTKPSLVSLSAGAIMVQAPKGYDDSWIATWILDGRNDTGWASPKGVVAPAVFVIALPEKTVLDEVIFDTGQTDGTLRGAKDILVEASDVSENSGFQPIASISLKDKVDNQRFPVSAQRTARWIRLTIKNNHGAPDYIELMDFRATGKQLTYTPFPDISGTYSTNYNEFHIRQQGNSVTGCYEYNSGLVEGGVDGRTITFTWREGDHSGPAIMVFTPDGAQMYGLWWGGSRGIWNGKRKSKEVGTCQHWSGGIQEQITKDLTDTGRSRLYGINFDFNSDRIKEDSKSTLDHIVAVLKQKPEWRMTIEGYTDDLGMPQYNQKLSEQRALSVKAYLVAAGIGESRLKAIGFGATKPVAPNDEIGRPQNRRVELVKE
jgi:outer membrane protein OmpA-like peptidoglycan-associated protein